MIDWDSLQSDIERLAVSHLSSSGTSSVSVEASSNAGSSTRSGIDLALLPPPPSQLDEVSSNLALQGKESYVIRELMDLREICRRQSQQISTLEKAVMAQNSASDSVQYQLLDRVINIEKNASFSNVENKENALIRNANNESDANNVHQRILKLENKLVDYMEKVSKIDALGELLKTTINHIESLGSALDNSKKKGEQSIVLMESMLQALYELNSIDNPNSAIDFLESLASLDGGEQGTQQQQIVGMLSDCFDQIVNRSVSRQMVTAIDSMVQLQKPHIDSLRDEVNRKTDDMRNQVKMTQGIVTDRMNAIEDVHSRMKASVDATENLMNVVNRDDQRIKESMQALESQQKFQQQSMKSLKDFMESMSPLSLVNPSGGNSNGAGGSDTAVVGMSRGHFHTFNEIEAIKDQLQLLGSSLDLLSSSHSSFKNSMDADIFDITQAVEKQKQLTFQSSDLVKDISSDVKEQVSQLRLGNQQIQSHVEQQAGDLNRKYKKIEEKIKKWESQEKEKSLAIPLEDTQRAAVAVDLEMATSMQAMTTRVDSLVEDIGSVRQMISNLVMDIDDVRDGHKALDKKIATVSTSNNITATTRDASTDNAKVMMSVESALTGVDQMETKLMLVESTITNLKDAMDTLQEEMVSIHNNSSDVTQINTISADKYSNAASNAGDDDDEDFEVGESSKASVVQKSVSVEDYDSLKDAYDAIKYDYDSVKKVAHMEENKSHEQLQHALHSIKELRSTIKEKEVMIGKRDKEIATLSKGDIVEVIGEAEDFQVGGDEHEDAVRPFDIPVTNTERVLAKKDQLKASGDMDLSEIEDFEVGINDGATTDDIDALQTKPMGQKKGAEDSNLSESSDFEVGSDSETEASQSQSFEEDIIGRTPVTATVKDTGEDAAAQRAGQLKMRAAFEREAALKSIAAKKGSSPDKKSSQVSGPSITAIQEDSKLVTALSGEVLEKTDVASTTSTNKIPNQVNKPMSGPPILSGSLLGSRRSGASDSGGNLAAMINHSSRTIRGSKLQADEKPMFESFQEAQLKSSLNNINNSDNNTAEKNSTSSLSSLGGSAVLTAKNNTIQCQFCLRRVIKSEMQSHLKICELRYEPCEECGIKVLVLKMDQHLLTCKGKKEGEK